MEKILKINNACSESWDKMEPNERGNYCKICEKTVLDFTRLSQKEILEKLNEANGEICARLTSSQFNTPIFDYRYQNQNSIPYSKIAAGLVLASSLIATQPSQANNFRFENQIVQTINQESSSLADNSAPKPQNTEPSDTTIFEGIVKSEDDELPIENARITFISLNKLITVYSDEYGKFIMKIPSELIDTDNVVRVSYEEVESTKTENKMYLGFKTDDYILNKSDIKTDYNINAQPDLLIVGGVCIDDRQLTPIVIINGKEVSYKAFIKSNEGKRSKYDTKNMDTYYFESDAAIAIYGKKAKGGLYLLFDKL